MALDTSFLLGQPATPLLNPLDIAAKKIAIRNALAAGAIQNQNLQVGALDLEQKRQAIAADAQYKALFASTLQSPAAASPTATAAAPGAAIAPGAPLGAAAAAAPQVPGDPGAPPMAAPAPPPPDASAPAPAAAPSAPRPHEVSDDQLRGLFGTGAETIISKRAEMRKNVADTTKLQVDAQEAQGRIDTQNLDYWGHAGQLLKDTKGDPRVVAGLLSQAAADGKQGSQQFGALLNAARTNPSSIPALADQAVAMSPKQQELNAQKSTADAHQLQANTTAAKDAAELPGLQARNTSQFLGAATNKNDYARRLATLPADQQTDYPAAANWTAATRGQILQQGLSPKEQVETAEKARADAQTAAHENAGLGIERARLGLEQARFTRQTAGALSSLSPADQAISQKVSTGDFNPTLLSRMPNKEGIIAGAIEMNPQWTPQIYDVKKSFKEGRDSDALGSITRVLGHLDSFGTNSDALGFSALGSVGINTPGQAAVAQDANAISEEFGKLVKGGTLTQDEATRTLKGLQSSRHDIRTATAGEITNLMKAQFEAKYQKYKTATGLTLPADQFFDQPTMGRLQRYGALPEGYKSPAAAAAPAAAPAAAAGLQHMSTDDLLKKLSQ